jgi:hypothetical protein
VDVYLEMGKKRVFAAALGWPGWSRSGKDEHAALQTLLDYAPRYAQAIEAAHLGFQPPADASALKVVERLPGNVGTDFGAPSVAPAADSAPLGESDAQRSLALLEAIWQAFDAAVRRAEGKELRKGSRGGGRDLEKMLWHVLESEEAYLRQLGGKLEKLQKPTDPRQGFAAVRQAIRQALPAAARGELPQTGPRGGQRWRPRFFVRYAAWHLLDHAWEIEDRAQ